MTIKHSSVSTHIDSAPGGYVKRIKIPIEIASEHRTPVETESSKIDYASSDSERMPKSLLEKLKSMRTMEKDRLNKLNTRLLEYINRIRLLETTNEHLGKTVNEIKERKLEEISNQKRAYEMPLAQARQELNSECEKKVSFELKERHLSYIIELVNRKCTQLGERSLENASKLSALNEYNEKLKEELNELRKVVQTKSSSVEECKALQERLEIELVSFKEELDRRLSERLRVQIKNQAMSEKLAFSKRIHDCMKEEIQRQQMHKEPLVEKFTEHELSKLIADIRRDFESLCIASKQECEEYYKGMLELVEERLQQNKRAYDEKKHAAKETRTLAEMNERLASELNEESIRHMNLMGVYNEHTARLETLRLNSQCELTQKGKQIDDLKKSLTNSQLCAEDIRAELEFELSVYRRLLSYASDSSKESDNLIRCLNLKENEQRRLFDGKMNNYRETRGPIGISEISIDSKKIVIENTSDANSCDLSGWVIKRKLDNKAEIVYKMPRNCSIGPKCRLNIWANDSKISDTSSSEDNLINTDLNDWGTGGIMFTKLFDADSRVKSIYVQKTIFRR
jgi:hypothetical protein